MTIPITAVVPTPPPDGGVADGPGIGRVEESSAMDGATDPSTGSTTGGSVFGGEGSSVTAGGVGEGAGGGGGNTEVTRGGAGPVGTTVSVGGSE